MTDGSIRTMTPSRPRRWPWVVAAATIVVFIAANVMYPDADADIVWTTMFSGIILGFVIVGAVLSVRVPGNPIGPILLGSGAVLALTIAMGTAAIAGAQRGDIPIPVLGVALLLNDLGFIVPIVVVLIGVPLIFPDGRLLSPRWRWVVVLAAAALTANAIVQILGPGPIGAVEVPNPFEIPALAPALEALDAFAAWSSIIGFGGAALAVILRYRRGDEIQRHQLKWLIAVALVALVAFPFAFIFPGGFAADIAFLVGLLALLALPLVIGIAILRYRLYDIDRIISRTIGWAIISGLLLTVFVAMVVGLQGALAGFTQGQTLAVAASTLVAAALFNPVRVRVQRAVDRRFNRSRYDAERIVADFGERLRHQVDLLALEGELGATATRAVEPASTSVWLRRRGPA